MKTKNPKNKKCAVNRKITFEYYRHCLDETQLEKKGTNSKKLQYSLDSFRENHKEFIKINKLILKSQQRFRSKKQKIVFSANDDKRIQSVVKNKSLIINTKC